MALRQILTYPNEELLKDSIKVSKFDEELKTLVEDMFETMRANNGIGLAAAQVGVLLQVLVMELPENDDSEDLMSLVLCNPKIVSASGHVAIEEGCLSLPEFYLEVDRHEEIVVEAQDSQGKFFELAAKGLMAICIQHEMDHLNGKLLVDYATRANKAAYRKKRNELASQLS